MSGAGRGKPGAGVSAPGLRCYRWPMLRINPFVAYRPLSNMASQVACPPYDVVSRAEAAAVAAGNPISFMHVIRPEIDLPADLDEHDDAVYQRGRDNLQAFIRRGVLHRDDQPRMYLYRLVMAHRTQIGLVCCSHIDDYLQGRIRKHEKTRKDKEDDRTRHVLAMNAHAEPVFLTYRDHPDVDALVLADTNDRPVIHFNAPDGITHTAWTVKRPAAYQELFRELPCSYVADGHHRTASAARAGEQRRAANPRHTGAEEYNWFLTVLFPASQLRILPYNRLVADLNGQTVAQVLPKLEALGTLTSTHEPSPDRPGVFCIYMQGIWRRLELDDSRIPLDDPIGSLDVALLQQHVLTPVFGIGDPRTDKRLDFVGGIRGTGELKQRVDRGDAAVAISMHPTTIGQLLTVSDAGAIMPPKSTWFEPKLRSGLFVHMMD
jgi:uncharacterized protein (DUF1015 family)